MATGGLPNEIRHLIGAPFLIFDYKIELLQISGPLEVALFLNLALRIDEDEGMMICV